MQAYTVWHIRVQFYDWAFKPWQAMCTSATAVHSLFTIHLSQKSFYVRELLISSPLYGTKEITTLCRY